MSEAVDNAAMHADLAQQYRDRNDRYSAAFQQRRAVALLRDAGEPPRLLRAIRALAEILIEDGRAAQAEKPVAEMLSLARHTPDVATVDLADALRCAALHAEAMGDRQDTIVFWLEARVQYSGLDADYARAGIVGNPGVEEADARLARLR